MLGGFRESSVLQFFKTRRRLLNHSNRRIPSGQGGWSQVLKPACVTDIDQPRSTRGSKNPSEQLRLREHRATAEWKIRTDNLRRKCGAEAIELCEPLVMGANDSEVSGALSAGASSHGAEPSGLVLLSNTVWHGSQIFRINPAIAVVKGCYSVLLVMMISLSGTERFCSISRPRQSQCDVGNVYA